MLRFMVSTCSVLMEVAALQLPAPATAIGVAVTALACGVSCWWGELGRFVDQLVGFNSMPPDTDL
jgi:hypothetical protein